MSSSADVEEALLERASEIPMTHATYSGFFDDVDEMDLLDLCDLIGDDVDEPVFA